MSDFNLNIPGVTNKYKSDTFIKALMEAERTPLSRMEKDLETFKVQKSAWFDINRKLSELRESARKLYGFQNPFSEKIADTSNAGVLTATANRTAFEEEKRILVRQIATADRFVSKSLPNDFTVEAGLYRFKVGDQVVELPFSGGSLKELASAINAKAGNLLKASVVDDTKDTQVFALEAKKTGSRNQLVFQEQAVAFGEKAGILSKTRPVVGSLPITRQEIQAWQAPLEEDRFAVSEGALTAKPGAELKLTFQPGLKLEAGMALEMEVKVTILPEEPYQEEARPPGPSLPEIGGIEFQGLRVQSSPSKTVLPEWKPPSRPLKVDDMQILFAAAGQKTTVLPPLKDSDQFTTLRLGPDQLPEGIDSLNIRNRNTHRIVQIRNLRVVDTTARGDYRLINPLSTAQDARLGVDGIEVVRETNTVDDLLPGVSLTLNSASPEAVALKIRRDVETVKESIIAFLGIYNQLLTELDIMTRKDEAVIEDAKFLSDQEREKARKNLGLLQGNVSLMQLKTSLQNIMMNPYPTGGGKELSLLAQIGVSTSARLPGQSAFALDKTRLRGYLQVDEGSLETAMRQHPEWVKDLFGFDANKDLVTDTGVAYALDTYLKPYAESKGIVSNRIGALEDQIARKNKEIEAYNHHLEDYEKELKKKYGIMEGALDSLEQSSQALENFNKQSNR